MRSIWSRNLRSLLGKLVRRPWTIRDRYNEFIRGVVYQVYSDWKSPVTQSDGFQVRRYERYEDYLAHQKAKLKIVEANLSRAYGTRLEKFVGEFSFLNTKGAVHKGAPILCLGARDGVEVEALRNLGFLAIGIDISIPEENCYVHFGDFQKIPYPDRVFEVVYTNCLDHAFDLKKIFSEVSRVLKSGGLFVTDLPENAELGSFESIGWSDDQKIIDSLIELGFNLEDKELTLGRDRTRVVVRRA